MTTKLKIPDSVLQQHDAFLQTVWAEVEQYVTDIRDELKVYWEREQKNLTKINTRVQNELDNVKGKHNHLLGDYNQLDQANQLLEKSIEQRSSDLRANEQIQVDINRKNIQFLEEIKQLTLELGRLQEKSESSQKKLEKSQMQLQEEQEKAISLQQELRLTQNNKKNYEQNLQHLQDELSKTNNQLRIESHRATVAETLSEENKSQREQSYHEVIQLKASLKSNQEKIEITQSNLHDANKRVGNLKTQAEMQANFNQKNISQLEIELKSSKSELSELRQRVIKAESASERERKAMERLENKLLTMKR